MPTSDFTSPIACILAAIIPLCSLAPDALAEEAAPPAGQTLGLASATSLSFSYQPEVAAQPAPAQAPALDTALAEAPARGGDKSGTDPTLFLRNLTVSNELQGLKNDNYANVTSFKYIEPFADGKMNLRLTVPLVATDRAGDGDFGLGDIGLRYNWLAQADKEGAWLFGTELFADTATEDVLGRGKWIIAPIVTKAFFLSKSLIFAPTYQHNISFAGDSRRESVNESVLDFYFVMRAADNRSWFTVDPTLVVDWENQTNTPATIEFEYGRVLGSLLGGAASLYVRPGVGIGQDRPYDWNIEIGFKIIGF